MTKFSAPYSLPLTEEAKVAIHRAARREQGAAFAAVGRAVAGGVRRLFSRKPSLPAGAGFAR